MLTAEKKQIIEKSASIRIELVFDAAKFRTNPKTCVKYEIKSLAGNGALCLPEWSAVKLTLQTVLSNIVKPMIGHEKTKNAEVLQSMINDWNKDQN